MNNSIREVCRAALDTLQGARKLPGEQAAQRLREFLQSLTSSGVEGARMKDASSALTVLVDNLEQKGVADNDAWQHAIETMVSLLNEEASVAPPGGS
jgi:hypothetical protein